MPALTPRNKCGGPGRSLRSLRQTAVPRSGHAGLSFCALLLLVGAGCTSVSPRGSAAVAPAGPKPSHVAASSSQMPFGEDAAEPAPDELAVAEPTPSPIRQSAWTKLKGAISRPQPIPLPSAAEGTSTDEGAERPYPTVDGRDF